MELSDSMQNTKRFCAQFVKEGQEYSEYLDLSPYPSFCMEKALKSETWVHTSALSTC